MQYMIGNGENMYDFTYVGNVVQAHLLAAEKLTLASPIAGQAYFITNQARPSLRHITHSLLTCVFRSPGSSGISQEICWKDLAMRGRTSSMATSCASVTVG